MRRIARHYPRLNVEERFRLIVGALARNDEQEVRRLLATCPPEGGERSELNAELALTRDTVHGVGAQMLLFTDRLSFLRTLRPGLDWHANHIVDEAAFASYVACPDCRRDATSEAVAEAGFAAIGEQSEFLEEVERQMKIEAASFYRGFVEFSRDILRLESMTLVEAFIEPPYQRLYMAFDDEEPDPERTAVHFAAFIDGWGLSASA